MVAPMASNIRICGSALPGPLSLDRPRCAHCGGDLGSSTVSARLGNRTNGVPIRGNVFHPLKVPKSPVLRSSAGDDNPENSDEGKIISDDFEKFVMAAGGYGGLSGTAALWIGYLLKIDPFGHFHVDWNDLVIGFECMLPSFLFQFALMSQNFRQQSGSGKAVSISSEGGRVLIEPVVVGKDIKKPKVKSRLGSEIEAFKQAARAYALKRVLNSSRDIKGMTGSLPLFLAFLIIANLAEEMLFRGVGLTALSLWVRDRLYEAGAEDLFFNTDFPTVEAAKWGALAIASAGVILALVNSLQDTKERRKKLQNVLDNFAQQVQQVSGMENVAKFIDPKTFPDKAGEMVKVYMLQKIVGTLDTLLELVGASAAFILTGNLFASFVPVMVGEIYGVLQSIESLYSDLKAQEPNTVPSEIQDSKKLGALQGKMNDLKVRLLVTAVKRYLETDEEEKDMNSKTSPPMLMKSSENGHNSSDNGAEDAEEGKVDVSVNGEVLLMLVRREIGNLSSSIKEEKAKDEVDTSRIEALEADKQTLSDLLPKVELKVQEHPEEKLGTYLGKKSEETVGAGRKDSNTDRGGDV